MNARGAAAAAVLLTLAGCAPGQAPASPGADAGPQPALTTTTCADLIVLGARGNAQSATTNFGAGREVRASVAAMAEHLHERTDSTVRLEGVPFPSDSGPGYTDNVFRGVDNLRAAVARLSKECPDSLLGLVGFSQGAQIVHGYAITMAPREIRRIAVIGMMADPRHQPGDDIAYWSYDKPPTPGHGKLGAGTPLPAGLRSKAIAFCAPKDEVCNWPSGGYSGTLSQTHRHFYEKPKSARSTGEQLAKVLERNGL